MIQRSEVNMGDTVANRTPAGAGTPAHRRHAETREADRARVTVERHLAMLLARGDLVGAITYANPIIAAIEGAVVADVTPEALAAAALADAEEDVALEALRQGRITPRAWLAKAWREIATKTGVALGYRRAGLA